jgi:hypothetical protein
MRRGEHVRAQPRENEMQTGGSGICEHSRERGGASNALARASASTTAKEGGASNAAARASVSTTAKEADYYGCKQRKGSRCKDCRQNAD